MHKTTETIYKEILSKKIEEINSLDSSRKSSLNDANNASNAMQSRYDTFREEAQYLTGAYAKQQTKLQEVIKSIKILLNEQNNTNNRVTLGSLVTIKNINTEESKYYVLVPDGSGGGIFHLDDKNICAISIMTPISKAIITKNTGDIVELTIGNRISEWELINIQ